MIPFPNRKYSIIYADPPWQYNDKLDASRRLKYSTEDLSYLSSLPVRDIADKNCVLFMWATMPLLDTAFDVIEDWGFTYKTCGFTWIKTIPKGRQLDVGMGHWTRANAELCLLAVKGKPKRVSAGVHQVVISPRRNHSQKPDEVRDRIVRLCGDLPRIELFARERADGWDAWGDQTPAERKRTLLD